MAALTGFIATFASGGGALESFLIALLFAMACQFGYVLGAVAAALLAETSPSATASRSEAKPRNEER
jgi:hypothetical protein